MALKPAVFLDKDGTLIIDLPYNVDPARLILRPDAGPALARLQAAGYLLVLVSNQPGIGEGRFAENALDDVWTAIRRQLAVYGVDLAGIYYCPHRRGPDGTTACTCRKPQPGMLLRAADEHGIDLAASWMVGDIIDDVEAGRRAGCRTVLLDVGSETEWRTGRHREPDFMVPGLAAMADCILGACPVAPRRMSGQQHGALFQQSLGPDQ